MNLIVIHKNNNSPTSSNDGLLRFGISSEPIASVIFDGLSKNLCLNGDTNAVLAIPEEWHIESYVTTPKIKTESYAKSVLLSCENLRKNKRNPWFIISDGRFVTKVESDLLYKALAGVRADVVAVNVEPELLVYREKVRLTTEGKVAGFRRLYSDSAEPAPIPDDWPHHLFIKTDIVSKLLVDGTLPLAFPEFINRCSSNSLMVRSINIAGTVLNLETEEGLLGFLATRFNSSLQHNPNGSSKSQKQSLDSHNVEISDSARLFGKVLFGQNISIGQNAIIVGPTIIGNNVKIAKGAVIRASILGPDVSVPRNHLIQNNVIIGRVSKREIIHLGSHSQRRQKRIGRVKAGRITASTNEEAIYKNSCANNFRTWPRFSYARCFKRIADVFAAIAVLILFAPVVPIIVLVIKLTSRGPVFFKDTRQGLHGKGFNCLKFRTMVVGADEIQDKLRVVNQVDGPQFKLPDDPRISAVGRFLRDTYIDEIPQFFNVLLGQMSVVGPRPSPEVENSLCPSWRDARLSVRPGITGLWQVCRTRQPMKDFQEWIYYDTKYIRDLSLRMDLWICWRTVTQLVKNFVSQFYEQSVQTGKGK